MSTPNPPSIRDRVLLLIRAVTTDSRRFKELEERTKVPAATWRSFWNRDGALPSGAMLEEIGREWPQFAFWTLTGIDDWENGHVAPHTAEQIAPERRTESPATTAYFTARINQENRRTPRGWISDFIAFMNDYDMTEQAAEMLGGWPAVAEIRKELTRRGVVNEPDPASLTDFYKDDPDPVLDRAKEALMRKITSQQSAALIALSKAREAELLTRREPNDTPEHKER